MSKSQFARHYLFRMICNSMLVGIYVVLSYLVISVGGLKITFEHFPVVFCAVVFGPIDAILVGGLAEFINQVFSYGVTPTTILWILPIVFRGLSMGVCVKLWKKQLQPGAIVQKKIPVVFLVVCAITGVFSSCLNTLALYIDSKMFGYYSYALVFGSLLVRILLGIATSVVIAMCIKPVLNALRKANLIS